jgi:ER membrane protein complex subunit 1, C-terminal
MVRLFTDVFCTRVTPSKTFDLLAPTFNYGLLLLVIAALTVGNFAAGIAAKRKLLAAQWA